MELGSNRKMITFEPIDDVPAPAEPDPMYTETLNPEVVQRLRQLVGDDALIEESVASAELADVETAA